MIHNLFSTAPEVSDGEKLKPPAKGSLLFDGLNSSTRPLYRPTIYQHIQNGKSISSSLLEPLQRMPDYITETEAQAQVEQSKETTRRSQQTEKNDSTAKAGSNTKDDTAEKSSDKSKKSMTKEEGWFGSDDNRSYCWVDSSYQIRGVFKVQWKR